MSVKCICKVSGIVLALALVAGSVAGCAPGAPASTVTGSQAAGSTAAVGSTTDAPATSVSATTASSTAAAATSATSVSAVTTVSATATAAETDTPPVEMTVFAPLFSDPPDMAGPYWTEWMRLTNSKLDVEWAPSGDYATKLNLKLASDSLPEMVVIEGLSAPAIDAIRRGALWKLDQFLGDLSQFPNLRDNLTPGAFKFTTVEGSIYGIPRSRSQIGNGLKIRKDWLDKLGLPVPTTVDEYTDALRAIVADDPTGAGTIGLICFGPPSTWVGNLRVAFGYEIYQNNEEGGLLPPFLSDNYFDFIEWVRGLYTEGLIPQEFVAIKLQASMDLFAAGQGASLERDIWWDYQWEQALQDSQPGAEFLNLAIEGPKGRSVLIGTGVNGGMYVSSKVPEEKVARIMDYFERSASKEATDLAFYGLEGVHHEVTDGVRKLNDFGVKEIVATCIVLGGLDRHCESLEWGKIDSASAPREYNLAKRETVKDYVNLAPMSVFGALQSLTWSSEWPKFREEFEAMETRAVVGQASMDEFRTYVEDLRGKPELKAAFLELAQAYESFK